MSRTLIYLMGLIYISTGIWHFVDAELYLPLMPPYLLFPEILNFLAGLFELLFGLGVFIRATRKWAAWGLILLLIAFIPVHVFFIQSGSCIANSLCFDPWISWVRLILIHPFLILWAYWVSFQNKIETI